MHIRQRMLLKLLSNIYKVWVSELFELFTVKFWKFVQFEELFPTVSINMVFDKKKYVGGSWLVFCTLLQNSYDKFSVDLFIFSNVLIIFLHEEFNTLYHRDLRQDIFLKDDYHYLNVPRVGTYAVYDTLDCTLQCLSNPSCFSINLAASKGADGKLWCELLSSNRYSNPGEYKRNESSHHFFIKVSIHFFVPFWFYFYGLNDRCSLSAISLLLVKSN